jgi:hypothetical protein
MGPTQLLIQDYAREKHLLGKAIHADEIDPLIESLRRRFDATGNELDLSPASLKRLESHLISYYHATEGQGQQLEGDDLVKLLREIAAYLGHVLILHANGQWDSSATALHMTGVLIEGPWYVQKGGKKGISAYPTKFVVASDAAGAWDALTEGRRLKFYQTYREAKSKSIKERLP